MVLSLWVLIPSQDEGNEEVEVEEEEEVEVKEVEVEEEAIDHSYHISIVKLKLFLLSILPIC